MQDEPQSDDPASQARERLGWTLAGKWRLQRVIGVGGMAAVYEAQHRNHSRVAIKMLHSGLSRDSSIRRRFLQEGYAGNSVHHPGVPRVLDDDTAEDGSAFLVMDLLDGRSLEDALEELGRLHPAHALMIADQVLDVLEVAHARGVVHRDIKPDNIFLTTTGEVKLLDFGIARVKARASKGTTMGSFMGTPAYCSPEQARGRWSEVDERTDLWALGATLFNALTGRAVHQAETPTEQLALAVHAHAPSIRSVDPDVPADLAAVIDQVLLYDKEDRPPSATAFSRGHRPRFGDGRVAAPRFVRLGRVPERGVSSLAHARGSRVAEPAAVG